MKILILLLTSSLLASCATSGYKQYYKPYPDAKTQADIIWLPAGEEPKALITNDFKKDILELRSKKYIPIGYSSFNGGYEDTKNALAQAKQIGATLVLLKSQYTNTRTTTSTLVLPDNKTTYHSGSVSGNTSYNSAYSGYLGSSNTSGRYSGTSTTYGTKSVPITRSQRRYDQSAVYLVKSTKKYKFGFHFNDLTSQQRSELERNTGVYISVIIDDSPAFNSNVLAGDILIKMGGELVKNTTHALALMRDVGTDKEYSELTVLRRGLEKNIKLIF